MSTTTSSDYGVVTGPGSIRFERLLPGPIERVWAYITEPDKRALWFAGGPMELRIGGKIEFFFDHKNFAAGPVPERHKAAMGTTSAATVTRCEPPRLLSFLWGEKGEGPDEVTFELAPQASDVLLVVAHRGLATRADLVSVGPGWQIHLGVLEDRLHGRDVRPFWPALERLEAECEELIPRGDAEPASNYSNA